MILCAHHDKFLAGCWQTFGNILFELISKIIHGCKYQDFEILVKISLGYVLDYNTFTRTLTGTEYGTNIPLLTIVFINFFSIKFLDTANCPCSLLCLPRIVDQICPNLFQILNCDLLNCFKLIFAFWPEPVFL